MVKKEEPLVSVPLDAAREAVEVFDTEKREPSLVLLKVAMLIEMDADQDVPPHETLEKIHTLVDANDVPGWYAGLMMGIAKHEEEAA